MGRLTGHDAVELVAKTRRASAKRKDQIELGISRRVLIAGTRIAVVLAALAFVTSACGGGETDQARIEAPPNAPDPLVSRQDTENGALDDPEKYGLPSLEVVQANPRGVAQALFEKMPTTTWTLKWLLRSKGFDAGEILVENLPAPSPDQYGMLHVAATLGTADVGTREVEILDTGVGARSCVREGNVPWICDIEDAEAVLQFLSLEGLERLSALLTDSLAVPGLTVQYLMMSGTPAVCFNYPPLPMTGQSIGLDFSSGGAFCLSPEGALLALQAGEGLEEVELRAFEYDVSADPQKFKLPIDPSADDPAPQVGQ